MTISDPSGILADLLIYSREESAAQLGGMSLRQLDELIARGEIESIKIGRLRKIPREALTAYIKRLRGEQAK